MTPITCAHPECDETFIPTNPRRMYCSPTCGKQASNLKEKAKNSRGYSGTKDLKAPVFHAMADILAQGLLHYRPAATP